VIAGLALWRSARLPCATNPRQAHRCRQRRRQALAIDGLS
jgi:hypothetical protein